MPGALVDQPEIEGKRLPFATDLNHVLAKIVTLFDGKRELPGDPNIDDSLANFFEGLNYGYTPPSELRDYSLAENLVSYLELNFQAPVLTAAHIALTHFSSDKPLLKGWTGDQVRYLVDLAVERAYIRAQQGALQEEREDLYSGLNYSLCLEQKVYEEDAGFYRQILQELRERISTTSAPERV